MSVADDVVTYRLRIDLSGTEPPLWRELEVVSDLFLDELRWIIQVAFGREGRHLNQFTAQPGRNTEGTPDDEVRLDEVLVRPGQALRLGPPHHAGDGPAQISIHAERQMRGWPA